MRTGISFTVSSIDRERLSALARDRNAPQKHVWRAKIVLLSGDGVGTVEIMWQTAKSKTCVWRWQERFATEDFEGLLRDKTRPSRIPLPGPDITQRVDTAAVVDEAIWRRSAGLHPRCRLKASPDECGKVWPASVLGRRLDSLTEEFPASPLLRANDAPDRRRRPL